MSRTYLVLVGLGLAFITGAAAAYLIPLSLFNVLILIAAGYITVCAIDEGLTRVDREVDNARKIYKTLDELDDVPYYQLAKAWKEYKEREGMC